MIEKRKIGLFSGSFNPIHNGHLILANYMCEFTTLDEVWLIVTPHNPLKDRQDMLDEESRLKMAELAVDKFENIKASDVELHMMRPSFTINTLEKLSSDYPDYNFTLIIGADNWTYFSKWKDYETIIENYNILIYPRNNYAVTIPESLKDRVRLVNAPLIEISSTFIRQSIRDRKNIRAFLPPEVYDYIELNNLYR